MGLRDVRRRLTASTEELHHQSLLDLWSAHGVMRIADVENRSHVRIGGEVQGVQVIPRAGSPTLEVSIHDGTGRIVARFTGRRAIAGVSPGRRLLLEGFAHEERNRVVLLNPSYTLLPS